MHGQVLVPMEWFSVLLAVKSVSALAGLPSAASIAAILLVSYYSVLDIAAGLSWALIQVRTATNPCCACSLVVPRVFNLFRWYLSRLA